MLVIRVNRAYTKARFEEIKNGMLEQAKTGTIVLPDFCEVLASGPEPGDPWIVREEPVYSMRKNGVICSMSNLPYCGYSVEELNRLKREGFELYSGDTKINI